MREYTIRIYFTDSPNPVVIENAKHIQTEGQLLRIIVGGLSIWYPLCNVFKVEEISKTD